MDQERVGSAREDPGEPAVLSRLRVRRFLEFVIGARTANTGRRRVSDRRRGLRSRRDFDPRIDPIVRVQAAKLRSKLLEYYAGEGASDPIVITIPKGSYAPEFRASRSLAPHGVVDASARTISRIAVLPLLNLSADPENEYFSDGLTEADQPARLRARAPSGCAHVVVSFQGRDGTSVRWESSTSER